MLFPPKVLARAVAPWIAMLLAATGTGSIAFERFVARPEALRFAADGRLVAATVVVAAPFNVSGARDGGPRNRSLVAVNDEALGPQVISIYGALPTGTTVPLLCLTPVRRCMSATDIRERLELWPLTPLNLAGAAELGLAILVGVAGRRFRRARAAMPAPPVPLP